MIRGLWLWVVGIVAMCIACGHSAKPERSQRTASALEFELPTSSPPTGTSLGGMAIADMNGDGFADIIAGGWLAATRVASLELFLGDQGGAGSLRSFPLGEGSEIKALEVADLNGDAVRDVLASESAPRLWPAFGDGLGSFAPAVPIALDRFAALGQAVIADYNGDGHVDLIASGSIDVPNPDYPTCTANDHSACNGPLPPRFLPSPVLALVAGTGGGNFAPPVYVQSNIVGTGVRLALGDWNTDGNLDAAITWYEPVDPKVSTFPTYRLGFMFGQGNGVFGPISAITVIQAPIALFSDDFDGNASPDLAIAFSSVPNGGGGVRVLPGNGDGTFGEARVSPLLLTGTGPRNAARADVSGDGRPDLVITDGGTLHVLQADGSGHFSATSSYDCGLATPAHINGVAAGNVAGDGAADVALTSSTSSLISIVESKGGRLMLPQAAPVSASGIRSILTGHFDSDGVLDLLINATSIGLRPPPGQPPPSPALELRVFPGLGGGSFGGAIVSGGPADKLSQLALGDFNNDGIVDVAATMGQAIELWLGTGSRTFVRSSGMLVTGAPILTTPPVAGDFDRDGAQDLLTVFQRQSDARAVAAVFRGDGSGNLGAASEVILAPEAGMTPMNAAVADLTLDGALDVIVVLFDGSSRGTVALVPGDGMGGFGAAVLRDAGSEARGLTLADLDDNGYRDLVVGKADGTSGGLRIWFNTGAGGLSAPIDVSVPPPIPPNSPPPLPGTAAPSVIVPGDFDASGTVDLALAQTQPWLVPQVLSGLGGGALGPPLALPVLGGILVVGDLDGDRRSDIISASTNQPSTNASFVRNANLNQNTACQTPPCFSTAVQPVDLIRGATPVEITFGAIIEGGITGVESNTYGPLPPFGFKLGSPAEYFDIFTTALFSGLIGVCIDYNPLGYMDPNDVKLFHYDNGLWQNITTVNNAATGRICGETFSLSPFALLEPIPPRETVLVASRDAVLHRAEPNLNGGANPNLVVSGDSRVLVGFDLGSVDPSRVQSARLVLTVNDVDGGGRGVLVDAHPATGEWVEGNGDNGRRNQLGQGEGATWSCARDSNIDNRRPDCNPRWQGGAFTVATAPAVPHQRNSSGEVSWDVTNDVRVGALHGWLLKLRREQTDARVRYGARSSAPAIAPRLVLTVE